MSNEDKEEIALNEFEESIVRLYEPDLQDGVRELFLSNKKAETEMYKAEHARAKRSYERLHDFDFITDGCYCRDHHGRCKNSPL